MSVDADELQDRVDEPVEVCPFCESHHDHAGLATFTIQIEETEFHDREGVIEEWVRFTCPECGRTFAVLVEQHEDENNAGVI